MDYTCWFESFIDPTRFGLRLLQGYKLRSNRTYENHTTTPPHHTNSRPHLTWLKVNIVKKLRSYSSCFLISKEIFKSIKKTLSTWSSLVAGQTISFLTKHTWLMNFAVVAFLMEKFLRRNRQRFQIYSPVKKTAPTSSIGLFMWWL